MVLAALVAPDLAAALGGSARGLGPSELASASAEDDAFEDGACGEELEGDELVDCGAWIAPTLDDPPLIALMRATIARMSKDKCIELMTHEWSDRRCEVGARDCGKMLPGAPPAPGPKLATSPSAGDSRWLAHEIDPSSERSLGPGADERVPSSLALRPPVPPPRAPGH